MDELYSENLAQEVVRGMREAASKGLLPRIQRSLRLQEDQGQRRAKERPTLEVDLAAAPVVREIFEKSLRGSGLKELCKELNERGITNRGKTLVQGNAPLRAENEAYTGTAVWGKTSKGEKAQEPCKGRGERGPP